MAKEQERQNIFSIFLKKINLRETTAIMMIDEVDYDSNSSRVPIFMCSSKLVNSQQEVRSPSTLETSKLGFPSMKEDTSLINKKGGNHKIVRQTRAKARKTSASLTVGKDIELTYLPEYLSLALVGRFRGKIVGEVALHRWMKENWSSRGWILFKVKTEEERQKILNNSW